MALTELLRVRVDWDPLKTARNVMSRRHFGTNTRAQNDSKKAAFVALQPFDFCICVRVQADIEVYRGSGHDEQNIWEGLKWVTDTLFGIWKDPNGKGLLPDDSTKWFKTGLVEFHTGAEYAREPHVIYVLSTDPEWPRPVPKRSTPFFQLPPEEIARRELEKQRRKRQKKQWAPGIEFR